MKVVHPTWSADVYNAKIKDLRYRSHIEEAISFLTLIAGLLAYQNEIMWLACVLFAKAALDTLAGFFFASCGRHLMRELKLREGK